MLEAYLEPSQTFKMELFAHDAAFAETIICF